MGIHSVPCGRSWLSTMPGRAEQRGNHGVSGGAEGREEMPSSARRASAHENMEQHHQFFCVSQPSRLQCSAGPVLQSFPLHFQSSARRVQMCLDELGPHPARFWGGAGGLSPAWHPLLWPQAAPTHPNLNLLGKPPAPAAAAEALGLESIKSIFPRGDGVPPSHAKLPRQEANGRTQQTRRAAGEGLAALEPAASSKEGGGRAV